VLTVLVSHTAGSIFPDSKVSVNNGFV